MEEFSILELFNYFSYSADFRPKKFLTGYWGGFVVRTTSPLAKTDILQDNGGQTEVRPENWPSKLIMQLIPKTLVQTIGGQYFRSIMGWPRFCVHIKKDHQILTDY